MREDFSNNHRSACQPSDVAAYLDGELDSSASRLFEQHASACSACSALLTEQKRLLCLFDTAFGDRLERKLDLPRNFAQVITAHAQSDMTGVRHGAERRRALLLCALLAMVSFSLLGAGVFGAAVVTPVAATARLATSVAVMLGHAVADGGSGAASILRPIGGKFFDGASPLRFLTWLLLAGAALLLLWLIGRYHYRGGGGVSVHEQ